MKTFALYARLICAVLIPSFASFSLGGCAAGNFSITRSLGGWNDRFSPLPRGLIYIVLIIIPAYLITLLVDMVVTNTMDFWSGKTHAALNQSFEKDGVSVAIQNSLEPLRHTVITLTPLNPKMGAATVLELRETARQTIEVYRDGKKQSEVSTINEALELLTGQSPAAQALAG